MVTQGTGKRVVIVGGARTPFAKAGTTFRKYSALDLAVHSVNGLLEKQQLDPQSVDELVFGIVVVDARIPHRDNYRGQLESTDRRCGVGAPHVGRAG